MNYFKALGFVSYVIELLSLAGQSHALPAPALAGAAADIVYRAVDAALRGKASRAIDKEKLTNAVSELVDVILDVVH